MKFTVAKQDLEAALAVVSNSISSGGNDIHSHYVFRVAEDNAQQPGVEVLTSSGRMFGGCRVKAVKVDDFDEEVMFTCEGKRLKGTLPHLGDLLTFEFDDELKTVQIVDGKGTETEFQSLSAETFKLWDAALEAAELTCTVPGSRLLAAISYASDFVSDQEGSNPNLCVLEARDGVIYSTDKRAATLVKVKDIGESALRIHGKDASSAAAFLTLCGEGDVEVREGDKTQFLVRPEDGALFGTARFLARFPDIGINMEDEDQHQWLMARTEILRGIGLLTNAAAKEDNRLRICKDGSDVVLSMRAMTGKVIDFRVPIIESESAGDAPDLQDTRFTLDHSCLSKVVRAWGGDTIRFGVNVKSKGGYCRFLSEADGNNFLSIVAWSKK